MIDSPLRVAIDQYIEPLVFSVFKAQVSSRETDVLIEPIGNQRQIDK